MGIMRILNPNLFSHKSSKDSEGCILYKCNVEKVLSWLGKRSEYILEHFDESTILTRNLDIRRKNFPSIDING